MVGPVRAALFLSLCCASLAHAQDAFEIQVYSAETAQLGVMGFELHTNFVAQGTTVAAPDEHPTNHALHLTIEPHVGLASWCEAGMYFLTVLGTDGHYDFAGVKARFKGRWPEKLGGFLGLALNQELTLSGGSWAPNQGFEWELRPIIDADFARFYFAVNPIIGSVLSGSTAGSASFEPAVKASVKLTPETWVGAEYYGAIDFLGATRGSQSQRLFVAFNTGWTLSGIICGLEAGFGYDFVGPDRLLAKLIFSMDFPTVGVTPSATEHPAAQAPALLHAGGIAATARR
jgi:hypothetical protein